MRVDKWLSVYFLFIEGKEVRSADSEILLPQAQVAAIRSGVLWGIFFQDLPSDLRKLTNKCVAGFGRVSKRVCGSLHLYILYNCRICAMQSLCHPQMTTAHH